MLISLQRTKKDEHQIERTENNLFAFLPHRRSERLARVKRADETNFDIANRTIRLNNVFTCDSYLPNLNTNSSDKSNDEKAHLRYQRSTVHEEWELRIHQSQQS